MFHRDPVLELGAEVGVFALARSHRSHALPDQLAAGRFATYGLGELLGCKLL
jgi:hypothetical protein